MNTHTGNHMLDSLSSGLHATILASSEHVSLPQHRNLCEAGEHPQHLYFLTEGLCSIVVAMHGGGSAEVAMCGKEGLISADAVLGPQANPAASFMQIAGKGLRFQRRFADQLFADSPEFRTRVLAWTQATIHVSLQISGCSLLHEAEPRLARWLLMSSDCTESNNLPLTQEFLSQMLGTQRTTIALIAGELRRKGLIEYVRGHVTILDRPGLTAAACECYAVSQRALEHLN